MPVPCESRVAFKGKCGASDADPRRYRAAPVVHDVTPREAPEAAPDNSLQAQPKLVNRRKSAAEYSSALRRERAPRNLAPPKQQVGSVAARRLAGEREPAWRRTRLTSPFVPQEEDAELWPAVS